MKKKNYAENSEEDNEFDVDEPEEIQNNASDDDWTPEKDTSGGRRTSSRLRNFPPRARAPIIDASSTEEEGSDEDSGKRKSKGKGRGRQPAKKQKVSSTSTPLAQKKTNNVAKNVSSDSEPSSTTTATTTTTTTNSSGSPSAMKVSKDYTSGAFIVLKTDANKETEEPPLWKIDGKALLQKYIPFEQDGKTFYKNTSVYSGWTINNKDNYYPVTVIFKQQTRKEHIVEFNRNQIKKDSSPDEVSSSVPEPPVKPDETEKKKTPTKEVTVEKPIIKVKSFATVPATPVPTKLPVVTTPKTDSPPVPKFNKDFSSGSFLVLRTEASNVDPPLWKIDGKSLLQKYIPFEKDGKILYKNTAEYSGWSLNSKLDYFGTVVAFKYQEKKDHVVQLQRIKWDEPDDTNDD